MTIRNHIITGDFVVSELRPTRLSPGMKEHLEQMADIAGTSAAEDRRRDALIRKLFPTKEDAEKIADFRKRIDKSP